MGNYKKKLPKHIIKNKKPLTLIRIIRKNKNPQERERERVFTIFLWGKYRLNGRNDIEFIQNKMERRRVNI